MKVLVQFDEHFAGAPADAIWIVDSSSNREWFERHSRAIDQNSAVFVAGSELTIIWHVFDHHPSWDVIEVEGWPLTADIVDALKQDAGVARTENGFRLSRV